VGKIVYKFYGGLVCILGLTGPNNQVSLTIKDTFLSLFLGRQIPYLNRWTKWVAGRDALVLGLVLVCHTSTPPALQEHIQQQFFVFGCDAATQLAP